MMFWRSRKHGRASKGKQYSDPGSGDKEYYDKIYPAGRRIFRKSVCGMYPWLTGHTEQWGTFLDVKRWPAIKNPWKYRGQRVVIGSVTDGYNPQEKQFRADMDQAVSIERRLAAMKKVYDAGIRTVCFISPVFPGITDFEAIFERVRNQCDLVWLENLNLRGGFKKDIMDYIQEKYPDLVPLYDAIYNKKDRSYFQMLEEKATRLARNNNCPFVDNELPYGRAEQGHPVIVDYFYHEEVRGSENTGKRQKEL